MTRNLSIYDIATGETSKIAPDLFAVTTGRGRDDVYVVGTDYLQDEYLPGLESWQRKNSLARTVQNQRRPADHYTKVKSHWVTVTPNNRFVLSLNSHITESSRYYKLSVAALTWNSAESPVAGRTLFSTKALPREWLPSTIVLADGYTLITSAPLDSTYTSDIRAHNLDSEAENEIDAGRSRPPARPLLLRGEEVVEDEGRKTKDEGLQSVVGRRSSIITFRSQVRPDR